MFSELFSEEPFKLQMRFQRGEIGSFYGETAENEKLLGERRRWINENPDRYCIGLAQGKSGLEEAMEIAPSGLFGEDLDPLARAISLGKNWEPDFLVLSPLNGELRLVAGSVCFPSSWALEEKVGLTVSEIHGVVPGLNPALGAQIDGFLARIKPGISWERFNWGLSRSPELNQHPARKLPRLDNSITLEEVYLRVEHQSLVALPRSQSVLFGIRVSVYPLQMVKTDDVARLGFIKALETMPEELAVYKNLAVAREKLIGMIAV